MGELAMSEKKIVVLKFGSSVLRSEDDLPSVVHEIYRFWRQGTQVLAVVSAFGDTTDQLLRSAENICTKPEESALAALLATGETTASALLGIALQRAGIPAKVLDPVEAGLRTSGPGLDAELVAVNRSKLLAELKDAIVVLPGFAGRDDHGRTALLGRGGSDLSALFLAGQLGGHCFLIKDVDGLYTSDPARKEGVPARRFAKASYETACRVGEVVVQPKAVRFAASRNLSFTVTAIASPHSTEVGPNGDELAQIDGSYSPLRVALVGCGTVGGGVYERLRALPHLFSVTGVAVRNLNRVRTPNVLTHLLTEESEKLINGQCDVVVELVGGTESAASLVTQALSLGRHVVTANKALIAKEGRYLKALAAANGATICWSAAVGGALPARETIVQAKSFGRITGFSGILNSTTNFILDRLAQGYDFAGAVFAAQAAGLAEADPTLDLDGTDAAQKLAALAFEAFGVVLPTSSICKEGILDLDFNRIIEARKREHVIRLVATCKRKTFGLDASVAPVELAMDHPLASVLGPQNRLLIELEGGECLQTSGTGAGRWPTSEAVMADLLDIYRESCARGTASPELEECVA